MPKGKVGRKGGKICKQRLSPKYFKVSRFPLSLSISLLCFLAILQSCKSFISDNKLPLVSFSAALSPPKQNKQRWRVSKRNRERERGDACILLICMACNVCLCLSLCMCVCACLCLSTLFEF